MAYLTYLALGIGFLSWSRHLGEDVPKISALAAGVILLLWGMALTPPGIQMGVEAIAVLALLLSGPRYWGWDRPN